MMSRYTITEFAKICGTSPATVSRVLNNPELVAAPLRKHVEEKMKELGYKPNPFASKLSSKSSWGLALFVFDILNPFFALIVRRISHLAMEQGIPLTICDTENNADKERIYLDYLLDNKIAGVIFAEGISLPTIERAQHYTETVLIDRHSQEGFVSEVSSDNYTGGRQATEYLLQLNHQRIAFISGPENWPSVEDRFHGYRDALDAYGVPFHPELVYQGDLRYESGISAIEYFLTLPEWPTAIFSANDQMAYGAMSKARHLNIAIPEDISLVGFDDIPFHNFFQANLTTVKQDIPALCENAFSILIGKVNNGSQGGIEKRVVVPTTLKIGDTCRKLVGSVKRPAIR
ncbi:LacI family DNA-binding transcriptional regulator [Sediminispirochaeta smaragdinae]|jgi:DNA-binding LacI/PurR family transcriptional regulator|nr:LacI family DNA-binding transcriptional regulator [Sediminispirochaeta smaragdinae]